MDIQTYKVHVLSRIRNGSELASPSISVSFQSLVHHRLTLKSG